MTAPTTPQPGDQVLLDERRYTVGALHTVDEGELLALRDGRGPSRFVLASELGWTGEAWAKGVRPGDDVPVDERPCYACNHEAHAEEDGPCCVLVRAGEFERACGCLQ